MPKQQKGETKAASSFKTPVGVSKVKASPKQAVEQSKPVSSKSKAKHYPEEESSEYSFPDSNSQEHSHDGSVESSTDLSSSTTGSHDSSNDSKKRIKNHEVIKLDPETQRALEQKIEAQKTNVMELVHQDKKSSIIWLGNIPEGFVDHVMKKFFSQFGSVSRLIAPKTRGGRLRGHAYVEFMDPVVAQIVADTMNGYIMFKRILKCEVVAPENTGGCFLPPVIPRNRSGPTASAIQEAIDMKRNVLKGENLGQMTHKEYEYLKNYVRQEGRMRQRIEKLQINYSYKPVFQISSNNEEK
jgi:nucleolar protein 15